MQLHLSVMGVQLALLLAVPLLGLGIGSPQNWGIGGRGGYNGIQADHYLNGMEGLPRTGAVRTTISELPNLDVKGPPRRTTRTRPSWMRGPPRLGAGFSWNFPGGMNREYQQGQSWQRMDGLTRSGLGNRMGSPGYTDYSRAGQDRYGGIGLSDLVCL